MSSHRFVSGSDVLYRLILAKTRGAGMESKNAFRFVWQPYVVAISLIAVVADAVRSGTLAALLI